MTYTKTKNYPYPPMSFESLDGVRQYLISLRTAMFEADLGYSEETQTAFTDPAFESLTLSDLTASRPVITDTSKTLDSIAYTGATSFRANLGLETDDPVEFGALLLDQAAPTDGSTTPLAQAHQNASALQEGGGQTTDETLDNEYEAIKFVASAAHAIGSIGIRMKRSGSITNVREEISVALYNDSSGAPGSAVSTVGQLFYSSFSTSYTTFRFSLTAAVLTLGNTYWIVIARGAAPTGGGSILIERSSVGTGEHAYSSTGAVGSWAAENNKACWHCIYSKTVYGFSGDSESTSGVYGVSNSLHGVYGVSVTGTGVVGLSIYRHGVYGYSSRGYGVHGESYYHFGVHGISVEYMGIYGQSTNHRGVYGRSENGVGVYGASGYSYAGDFWRNEASPTAGHSVVRIRQDHASDTSHALEIRQDGTGELLKGYAGTTEKVRLFPTSFEMESDGGYYLGFSGVDGSWRMVRDGVNLVFEKRVLGVWTPDAPTLTLTGLTASLPVVTDASKALASLAYTGATSFRANLGLEPTDSPTFTGLTLSGLTAGRMTYAGVGGLISDTTVYWDNVNSRMGVNQAIPLYDIDITGTLRVSGNVGTTLGVGNSLFGSGNYRACAAINYSYGGGLNNIYSIATEAYACAVFGVGNYYAATGNVFYLFGVGYRNGYSATNAESTLIVGSNNAYSAATIKYFVATGDRQAYFASGDCSYSTLLNYRNAYATAITGNVLYSFMAGRENVSGANIVVTSANHIIAIGPYRALYNATAATLDYAIAIGHQAGLSTAFNTPCLLGRDSQPGAHLQVVIGSSYYTGGVSLDGKNYGLGFKGAYGTNADKVMAHANGTAPTTSPADCYQMWSADQAAGNACPHIRTESGAVLKLYQQAHVADASEAHAVTDPGDAPADADALRDDLVLNTIPDLETKLNALGAKMNAVLVILETNGLLASA